MASTASSPLPILLVDDEPQLLRSASVLLRSSGVKHVVTLDDSRAVMPLLGEQEVGVVVLDLAMPHVTGQELLGQIAAGYPDVPVILMTATNDLDTAVQCMQGGAIDYLVKPVEKNRFVSSVTRALEIRNLREEVLSLKEHLLTEKLDQPDAFAAIVTQSKAMHAIFRYVEAIAASRQPVLITGETGTGKELLARSVHTVSHGQGELVAVNVAGLDDTMFSDTLFGHTKGAFTGADQARSGLITQAADGTLFLDEIGDLAIPSQVKLLRLLQEGNVLPARRRQPAAEQRAGDRGDQRGHCRAGQRRGVSQGSVLPPARPPPARAAVARAPGRPAAAHQSFPGNGRPGVGQADPDPADGTVPPAENVRLPRQRARTGSDDLRRRRPAPGRRVVAQNLQVYRLRPAHRARRWSAGQRRLWKTWHLFSLTACRP